MKTKNISFTFLIITLLLYIVSCRPINLFSPFVNPSLMGNNAKMDAGYNAIAAGNYTEAIDYFTDVINSGASGNQLSDAYLGRATAYLNNASPNLNDVVADVLSGEISSDNQGEIVSQIVQDGNYDDFFEGTQNAADDYNSAIQNTTGKVDSGILFEAYQANMMAATGVGANAIALAYEDTPWSIIGGEVTLNEELDAIVDEESSHPRRIAEWGEVPGTPTPPPAGIDNGLALHVNGTTAETKMMGYLTNAFNALEELKANPPSGMSASDITDMQDGINNWVTNGLSEAPLS